MCLAKVARRRCHNTALADYDFASVFDRLPYVVFANEVGSFFTAAAPLTMFRLRGPDA